MEMSPAGRTTRLLLASVVTLSLFATQPSAAADARPLAAKDAVKVTVYEHPDLTTETKISDNGIIGFPLIGEVALAGLSTATASALIARRLEVGGYVRRPQVSVEVVSYGAMVSVLGLVNKPGQYAIEGETTVVDLLARAGGTDNEAARLVTVLTASASGPYSRRQVDVDALLDGQTSPDDTRLSDGDILFVPRAPVFYIYGQVQKPGAYRLARDMTVMQALSVSAGLTPRGTERGLTIRRRTGAGTFESVRADPETALRPDDVIYVRESIF